MKKHLILILFALITSFVWAQNNYQDVVYLKNGSVIRGLIIEQIPNESIKIETSDRSVFVYKMEEIEKMTKEAKLVSKDSEKDFGGEGLKSGYRGIIEIGYQFGVGNYGMDRFKFNVINGGQFNPYFYLGGGVGLRYYSDADAAVIPVFVHPRVNFLDSKISPYLGLSLGYSFNASNDFEGLGLLLSPSTGVTFNVSEKVNINVGLSYEMQDMDFYSYYGRSTESSGALGIDFGISF